MTSTAVRDTDYHELALAKNFLVRPHMSDDSEWEVSWGEGSARCFYAFPSELAAFLMTTEPSGTHAEWIQRLSAGLDVEAEEASTLVATFVEEGLLGSGDDITPGEAQWLDVEWSDALQLHWAERNCRWDHDYTNNPKVMTRYGAENVLPSTAPPSAYPCVPADGLQAVVLPDVPELDMSFRAAQAARRTHYQFANATVTLEDVATLLSWTLRARWSDGVSPLRVTQSYSRGEPFVGFVLFGDNPPAGCAARTAYQYDPASNVLVPVTNQVPQKWSDLMWGQHFADEAPMTLILAANWEHFLWKYRFARSYRWVYTECGAFMQTAVTAAAALGLGAWQSPAIDDAKVSELLGVEEYRLGPIYLAAFGRTG